MTIPVRSILHAGLRVDSLCAGAAWTVAVTSAILGDTLHPDVCLSGTIHHHSFESAGSAGWNTKLKAVT